MKSGKNFVNNTWQFGHLFVYFTVQPIDVVIVAGKSAEFTSHWINSEISWWLLLSSGLFVRYQLSNWFLSARHCRIAGGRRAASKTSQSRCAGVPRPIAPTSSYERSISTNNSELKNSWRLVFAKQQIPRTLRNNNSAIYVQSIRKAKRSHWFDRWWRWR